MWRLAEDTINEADFEALAKWLRTSPRLTQGELVRQFEHAWAEWNGSSYAVMVSSGSTANFMLIRAIQDRLGRSLRVGVSAVTWPTNVTPSLMLGHDLVFLDVSRETLGIDTDVAVAAMMDGLDVLFVTHLLGFCAITDEMLRMAEATKTILIEDACEAHGASLNERKVGAIGLAGTFSFYYGHHISTIEGGMITTDDRDLADHLRVMRSHGLARESEKFTEISSRHGDIDERFLFVEVGLNFRSSDLNAFLGLRQLEYLEERITQRNDNFGRFIDQAPDWLHRSYRTDGMSSFALPLISDSVAREELRSRLDDIDIESRPVVAGNLLRQPFLARAGHVAFGGSAPNADWIHDNGLYVGNGPHVTPEGIDRLLQVL